MNNMDTKELFKNIKPNRRPIKGQNGFFGYGTIPSSRSKLGYGDKRRLNRYLRKYGFDVTESWSLDYTITGWLSDNIGGYFRECGSIDKWSDFDLEGNAWDPEKDYRAFAVAERARQEDYLQHLDNFMKESDKDVVQKFVDFVVPRLDYLSKHLNTYPANFKPFHEWQELLFKMVKDLKTERYSKDFIKYLFALWD